MRNRIPPFFLIHTKGLRLFDKPQHKLSPQNSLKSQIFLSLLVHIEELRHFDVSSTVECSSTYGRTSTHWPSAGQRVFANILASTSTYSGSPTVDCTSTRQRAFACNVTGSSTPRTPTVNPCACKFARTSTWPCFLRTSQRIKRCCSRHAGFNTKAGRVTSVCRRRPWRSKCR